MEGSHGSPAFIGSTLGYTRGRLAVSERLHQHAGARSGQKDIDHRFNEFQPLSGIDPIPAQFLVGFRGKDRVPGGTVVHSYRLRKAADSLRELNLNGKQSKIDGLTLLSTFTSRKFPSLDHAVRYEQSEVPQREQLRFGSNASFGLPNNPVFERRGGAEEARRGEKSLAQAEKAGHLPSKPTSLVYK